MPDYADLPPSPTFDLEFNALTKAYADGTTSPVRVVANILSIIKTRGNDGVWIHTVPPEDVIQAATKLEERSDEERQAMPLFGMPFSVKDCIDVAGLPTTSACPAYKYTATRTNLAVQNALDAGAILIGKTNMDQFATGVVGVRSPYGVARNPFNSDYIPGGSSSGAAVSVSSGLCSFAFGSDTGGSGRVPASYNNIVGLKPTLGLLSRCDMVNASLHFDTVSIYTLTTDNALTVLHAVQGVDDQDPYGRAALETSEECSAPSPLDIGIPAVKDQEFFGNPDAAGLYAEGIETLRTLGHTIHEIDFEVFAETSQMMFEAPWLAERDAAVGAFIDAHPNEIDPVVKQVIQSSKGASARDAFQAIYQLHRNATAIRKVFDGVDVLAVPTVGTIYRVDEVLADPLRTNATNGRYLNFASMADLAAVAIPNGFLPNGMPMGITFVGPAFSDAFLGRVGKEFMLKRVDTMGATGKPLR